MSDDWITVIPENPDLVPAPDRQVCVLDWLWEIAPDADNVEVKVSEEIAFFDCGANLERALCPSCGAELPLEWWQQRMDDDYHQGFRLSRYPTPCCGATHTLHELVYDWPQGFGRFAVTAMNPRIGRLNEARRRELEQILGTPVRIIYQHR
jgi:hypothetical protein